MRKSTALFVLLMASIYVQGQTIRRVNPDPSVSGLNVYNTIQAAHDAAVSGDVLVIDAPPFTTSPTDLGGLNCTKSLTIYGHGYERGFLSDLNNLPLGTRASIISTVEVLAPSNNVKIIGVITGDIRIRNGTSNIEIARCNIRGSVQISGASSSSISNIIISQNYVTGAGFSSGSINISGNATGLVTSVTIRNNIFASQWGVPLVNQHTSNIQFINNTIYALGSPAVTLFNSVFINNLILNGGLASGESSNCTFNFNASPQQISANGSNNTVLANIQNQLVVMSPTRELSFTIINGSVLLTAGENSSQVGAFGGISPYKMGGLPPIPFFTKISNSGIGNNSTPVSVTVSGKSNN